MIRFFKISLDILKQESEVWINFSPGQNTQFNLSRSPIPPRFSGVLKRFCIAVVWALSKFSLIPKNETKKKDVLIFADSNNQVSVIEPFLSQLKSSSHSFIALAPRSILQDYNSTDWKNIQFSFINLMQGFILFVLRGSLLIKSLKAKDPRLLTFRLDGFISIYFWMSYFYATLKKVKPRYVLVSNDHNPSTRTLLALCRFLNIKTMYFQHAGVSERFHELDFDYSFLDGQISLDKYMLCEGRRSKSVPQKENRVIFLSGIKRKLENIDKNHISKSIGIIFKEADNNASFVLEVKKIHKQFKDILIRCHPSTTETSKSFFKQELSSLGIEFSDPIKESVSEFSSRIICLIGSNSTIHLEASICGVASIYYEFIESVTSDYYGFVENKVSFHARCFNELIDLINKSLNNELYIDASNIRKYHHTYGTEWFGKEAELVIKLFDSIVGNAKIDDLIGYQKLT